MIRLSELQVKLSDLQKNTKNIRNICILAHVDHGKTTLADSLIASNGIISHNLAGTGRYLDSDKKEQARGITMKSSAISLHFPKDNDDYLINLIDSPGHIDFSSEVSTAVRLCDGAIIVVDVVEGVCPQTSAVLRQAWLEKLKPVLVFNKLDRLIVELKLTPLEAHTRLLQLLEQVNAATGQLFTRGVLATSEATEEDNQKSSDVSDKQKSSDVSDKQKSSDVSDNQVYDWSTGLDDIDDSDIYFSPERGNVVFSSGIDGWAFRIEQFSDMYARKLNINAAVLKKTLWGDYYYDKNTKSVRKGAQAKGMKPMFVQFVLNNLWEVYDAVYINRNEEKLEKIVRSLGLRTRSKSLLKPEDDSEVKIPPQAVMRRWLPLTDALLAMVCEQLPSPAMMSEERVEKLLSSAVARFDSLPLASQQLKQDFLACSPADTAPCIVFVSKMISVDRRCLSQQNKTCERSAEQHAANRKAALERYRQRELEREEAKKLVQGGDDKGNATGAQALDGARVKKEVVGTMHVIETVPVNPENGTKVSTGTHVHEVVKSVVDAEMSNELFIAFARVFSGTIRKGQTLHVLGPKYDPRQAKTEAADTNITEDDGNTDAFKTMKHIASIQVSDLYMLMGPDLSTLEEVPAGNVLGIAGLEKHILKSGTLSSTTACPAFTDMYQEATPIVRVAVEPFTTGDMKQLVQGLKLLNQSDPSVEIFVQETGEHVIAAAGEVHLQKCLEDLRERFAKVKINVSAPTVPFRETIILPPTVDQVNEVIDKTACGASAAVGGAKQSTGRSVGGAKQTASKRGGKQSTSNKSARSGVNNSSSSSDDEKDPVVEVAQEKGVCLLCTTDQTTSVRIRAVPLPEPVTRLLDENLALVRALERCAIARFTKRTALNGASVHKSKTEDVLSTQKTMSSEMRSECAALKSKLGELFRIAAAECSGSLWNEDIVERIWSFGPKRNCTNILFNAIADYDRPSIWSCLLPDDAGLDGQLRSYDSSVIGGFQMATLSGPLCDEPMTGVGFLVEEWNKDLEGGVAKGVDPQGGVINMVDLQVGISKMVDPQGDVTKVIDPEGGDTVEKKSPTDRSGDGKNGDGDDEKQRDEKVTASRVTIGQFTGQLMTCVKEACRRSFQSNPQRLVWAMYKCVVQVTPESLGNMYSVFGKRNGRVLNEDMTHGWSMFNVTAVLPVVESFGFADELRKKTSGLASPQLQFSHWEVIDLDPYWVPTTQEEYLHFGEKADAENVARKHMNDVRRRKGLKVNEKIVEHAEKQRTLKKNK